MQTTGSHAQVYHGTAKHTSGGLTKKDLVVNKHGRIVSRKKMMQGKKALKYLHRAGYKAKKGSFTLFHKTAKKGTRRGKTAKKFF
jgi:predicted RNA binding protein YcfA (HicA-like mRNA interferase family)